MATVATVAAQEPPIDVLAGQLEAATGQERTAILTAHAERNGELLKLVNAHGAERFAKLDSDGALRAYRTAEAIAIFLNDRAEIARAGRWIGSCLFRKNDPIGSLAVLEPALELGTQLGDKRIMADVLQGMSAANILLGRLQEAEQAARRGIALNQELGDERRATGMMINLSTVFGERGDQDAKARMLRQAIAASEAGGFKDMLIPALNNLGVVYYDQGDYERSLQYLQHSAELTETQGDKSHLAQMHSNLAVMLARLGREKEALQEYDKAAAAAEARGDKDMAAHVQFNRADLYMQAGKTELALREFRIVSAHYETSQLRTDAIRSNASFAKTLLAAGDAKAAIEIGEKTLAEARTMGGLDMIWHALTPLAAAYLSVGKREQARAAFQEAIETVESVKLSGGDDEKENFFHEKAEPFQGMVRLLVEQGSVFDALQYAERAKARLLLDVLRGARAEIVRAMTEAEKQRERELSEVVAKLDAQLARPGDRQRNELLDHRNTAALDLDKFHTSLYQAHPELRLRRADFPPIQMAQIGELLPDGDTALLEYTVTESAVYLFALVRDSGGEPKLEVFPLRNPGGLAAQIEGYRAQLAGRDLQYKTTAQALYRAVLGPAALLLRRKKRLVIVPDGALWNLPFQALVTPQGRHVIEEAAVFYAPSLTAAREMLALPKPRRDAERTLLALGAPADTALPATPESAREVRQIAQVYGPRASTVLVGEQADKRRWIAQAPGYRILHLATHGVLNSNNPLYSYLVMNRVAGEREDSVLSAREILGMTLDAELTVLSACETARGRYRFGEGLIGLSWAFLVAGTPTTVVSQWKVDSASTSQLMVAFHRNLQAGHSGRAEALRGAVLQLLATPQYRHPFYWAGFVMIGNGY